MGFWKKTGKLSALFSVPAVGTYFFATAIVMPAVIFTTNGIISVTTAKSVKRTYDHYKSIYHTNFDTVYNFVKYEDTGFKVNNKPSTYFEVKLKDKRGTLDGLSGWSKKSQRSDWHKESLGSKVIIFVHGLKNSHLNSVYTAAWYIKHGYRVFSYDQRQAGENFNNGKISFGWHEKDDLDNLYKIISKKPWVKSIVIHGQSNGAATAMAFGEEHQKSIIDAKEKGVSTSFLIESGFANQEQAMKDYLWGSTLISKFITPQMKDILSAFEDEDIEELEHNYMTKIQDIKQPMFFLHSDEDDIVGKSTINSLGEKRDEEHDLKTYVRVIGANEYKYKTGHIPTYYLSPSDLGIEMSKAIDWLERPSRGKK